MREGEKKALLVVGVLHEKKRTKETEDVLFFGFLIVHGGGDPRRRVTLSFNKSTATKTYERLSRV